MVSQEKPTITPAAKPKAQEKPKALATPVDVTYLLMGTPDDSDFQIHKVGCRAYNAQKKKSQYSGLDNDMTIEGVVNQREVIMFCWDDIIAEEFGEESPEGDYGTVSWGWLTKHGYVGSVKFHSCLDGLPREAKATTKGPNAKKLAKTELATLVAEAAIAAVNQMLEENLADNTDAARQTAIITTGFENDDAIRQCVAQWMHGMPVDRDRWVAAGLPIPDRSDWAAFRANNNPSPDGDKPATDESAA